MKTNNTDHILTKNDKILLRDLLIEKYNFKEVIRERVIIYEELILGYYREFVDKVLGKDKAKYIINLFSNTNLKLLNHLGNSFLGRFRDIWKDIKPSHIDFTGYDKKLYGELDYINHTAALHYLGVYIPEHYPTFKDLNILTKKGDDYDYSEDFVNFLNKNQVDEIKDAAKEVIKYICLDNNFLTPYVDYCHGFLHNINTLEQLKLINPDWHDLLLSISFENPVDSVFETYSKNLFRRKTINEVLGEIKKQSGL